MENVGIKFKEFVYIYNFTYFKLIRMNLKSHRKGRNQKRLFNFLHNSNCRVTNRSPNPDKKGDGPNKPSTINL